MLDLEKKIQCIMEAAIVMLCMEKLGVLFQS